MVKKIINNPHKKQINQKRPTILKTRISPTRQIKVLNYPTSNFPSLRTDDEIPGTYKTPKDIAKYLKIQKTIINKCVSKILKMNIQIRSHEIIYKSNQSELITSKKRLIEELNRCKHAEDLNQILIEHNLNLLDQNKSIQRDYDILLAILKKSDNKSYNTGIECNICADSKCNVTLKCGHQLCTSCLNNIKKSRVIHDSCPYCRAPINNDYTICPIQSNTCNNTKHL